MYKKDRKSIYLEREDYGNGYRITYLDGIKKLIEDRKKRALRERVRFGQGISKDRECYRKQFCNMLGWPLNAEKQPILSVKENVIADDKKHKISRMQFELFEGFWFYGILMQHKTDRELPLVISQHGGRGTPEMACSFFDCENYNDMSLRIFEQGVHVFAPQTVLWQEGRFGPANCRNDFDNALKQLGGSIAALEIYSIRKCLDYFETQDYCNGSFGMAGLSYGGFYTLYTAAVDTRIKAALASSHFNDREKYNWYDKVWFNSANRFLDAQVAALVCPRGLRIEVGDNDELFAAGSAIEEYEILRDYYKEKPENLQFHVFQGVHEFCPEDDGVEWLISKI